MSPYLRSSTSPYSQPNPPHTHTHTHTHTEYQSARAGGTRDGAASRIPMYDELVTQLRGRERKTKESGETRGRGKGHLVPPPRKKEGRLKIKRKQTKYCCYLVRNVVGQVAETEESVAHLFCQPVLLSLRLYAFFWHLKI